MSLWHPFCSDINIKIGAEIITNLYSCFLYGQVQGFFIFHEKFYFILLIYSQICNGSILFYIEVVKNFTVACPGLLFLCLEFDTVLSL